MSNEADLLTYEQKSIITAHDLQILITHDELQ